MKRNKIYKRTDIGVHVGIKSIPMLKEFRKTLREVYGRDLTIHTLRDGTIDIHTSVNKLLKRFGKEGIAKTGIPAWVSNYEANFGAYLAGVIDGDGDVRIKRMQSPQYVIRITDDKKNKKLISIIEKFMKCGVSVTKRYGISVFRDGRIVEGRWHETEFCISRKNVLFIKNCILPHIRIVHKKNRIREGVHEKLKLLDL